MKIYLPQDMDAAGKTYLRERGYEILMGTGTDEETMCREITDCDGVIVRVAQMTEKIMRSAPKLKVIARHGVGLDNIDIAAATRLGIKVTNGPLSNADSVAEHTVAFILALAQKLPLMDACVREGNWNARNQYRLGALEGKTVGMIGFGKIASATARRLALGMGMKIITCGGHTKKELPEYVKYAESIEKLFSESDFVSLHCPMTDETRGMVDHKLLSLMKPTSYFINTARGELVCEKDLYEALKTEKIAGAALDVLSKEPPDQDNPLLSLKNVIFSPHCASHTNEGFEKMALHAAMGIDEVLSGKKVTWPVN